MTRSEFPVRSTTGRGLSARSLATAGDALARFSRSCGKPVCQAHEGHLDQLAPIVAGTAKLDATRVETAGQAELRHLSREPIPGG